MYITKFTILLFLFFTISCTKPESQKNILKRGVYQKYEAIVHSSTSGRRDISVKVWENDSIYTSYNISTLYDSINQKDTLIKSINILTKKVFKVENLAVLSLNYAQEMEEKKVHGTFLYQKFWVIKEN